MTNKDEVTLRHLWQQRRRRDRAAAQIVADAHVLSDVSDFVGDVLDSHGGESIKHKSDFEHDKKRRVKTQKNARKKKIKLES